MDNLRILKIATLLLLIFVGGAVAGILLDRHFAPRASAPVRLADISPAERPEYLLKEFTTALDLTPEQQQRVGAVLKAWGKEIAVHPEWTRSQRINFIDSHTSAVRTNLTAEQSASFERLLERLHRRHGR